MSAHEFIDNEVKTNDVVLFMKGSPQFPQCGFSGQVVQILDYLGVDYMGVNVLPTWKSAKESSSIPTGRPFRSSTSRANSSVVVTSSARCSRLVNSRSISKTRASPSAALPDP